MIENALNQIEDRSKDFLNDVVQTTKKNKKNAAKSRELYMELDVEERTVNISESPHEESTNRTE